MKEYRVDLRCAVAGFRCCVYLYPHTVRPDNAWDRFRMAAYAAVCAADDAGQLDGFQLDGGVPCNMGPCEVSVPILHIERRPQ